MIFKSYILENDNEILKKKNSYLFYGENLGLQDEIKKKLKFLNQDKELLIFNQDEVLDNSILLDEIKNISLFGKEKFFFIYQANDKILELISGIIEEDLSQKIFLFSGLLDKKSKLRNYFEKATNSGSVACYNDNEISIKKLIFSHLKGYDGITPQNINLIVESTNFDRVKLINELEKIKTYFLNKKIITEDLAILLNYTINEDFNLLKDAALSGNKSSTNKLLGYTIMEDEKNIYYLSIINQRLNKLMEAHNISEENNSSVENTIDKLKPPVFWKDKKYFALQLNKLNKDKIKKILNRTYELEIKMKSFTINNKDLLMKKLLIDICALANA